LCDAATAAADARVDVVKEDTNVTLEQAKAAYKVDVEQCEAKTGMAREACKSAAQATLDAAQAAQSQDNMTFDNVKRNSIDLPAISDVPSLRRRVCQA
jgi:GTP cyclohydrolase III